MIHSHSHIQEHRKLGKVIQSTLKLFPSEVLFLQTSIYEIRTTPEHLFLKAKVRYIFHFSIF